MLRLQTLVVINAQQFQRSEKTSPSSPSTLSNRQLSQAQSLGLKIKLLLRLKNSNQNKKVHEPFIKIRHTVRLHDEVHLHCNADGNPSPEIHWERHGQIMSGSARFRARFVHKYIFCIKPFRRVVSVKTKG